MTKKVSFPSMASEWGNLAKSYPEHKFLLATQLPAMFLADVSGNEISKKASGVEYFLLQDDDEQKIADFIADLNPDIAIAASFYVPPFDWLCVKDSLVAENLKAKGICTVCSPLDAACTCFDKWHTHQFFEKYDFPCAKAVYFHHELFISGGNRREIKSNVYKAAFFVRLKKLKFPVIIKDTTGMSSFGMDVVNSFEEAKTVLLSRKSSSDRIVEEMLCGGQFGLEAVRICRNGKDFIKVLPPFKFSVNRYGITSPKQSVKVGPVLDRKKYNLDELEKMIASLAEKMNLEGSANFDLVYNFSERKWYVLEINPRLSGMTTIYAASLRKSVPEMLFDFLIKENFCLTEKNFFPAMNIKFPLLSEEKLKKAASLPFMQIVNQHENLGAKQLREEGYSEMIFSAKNKFELKENLEILKKEFKNDMEEIFFKNAMTLLDEL